MNDEINYKNNPLHGVSIKNLLVELVDYYGFDILYAYLAINCFKTNPSIASSIKFLKKTDWAREKVESFYLYEFKHLPRATPEQFQLPPRDRVIPEDQKPGEPAKLSLEDAEHLQQKREKKAAAKGHKAGHRTTPGKKISTAHKTKGVYKSIKPQAAEDNSQAPSHAGASEVDPWAKWRK